MTPDARYGMRKWRTPKQMSTRWEHSMPMYYVETRDPVHAVIAEVFKRFLTLFITESNGEDVQNPLK
jgi:hypothetical protein